MIAMLQPLSLDRTREGVIKRALAHYISNIFVVGVPMLATSVAVFLYQQCCPFDSQGLDNDRNSMCLALEPSGAFPGPLALKLCDVAVP